VAAACSGFHNPLPIEAGLPGQLARNRDGAGVGADWIDGERGDDARTEFGFDEHVSRIRLADHGLGLARRSEDGHLEADLRAGAVAP
jgi:hypothetical protein